jgi:hypothetical protein
MAQAEHVLNAIRAWNTGAIADPSTSAISSLAEYVAAGLGLLPQLYSRPPRRPQPTGGRNDRQ